MPEFEFTIEVDEDRIRAEKAKARTLRNSQWWKNKRASGLCKYCRERFPARELTMDHVVPIVRGGRSIKSNLVPCCKPCNDKKKYLLPIEWQSYLDSIALENSAFEKPALEKPARGTTTQDSTAP